MKHILISLMILAFSSTAVANGEIDFWNKNRIEQIEWLAKAVFLESRSEKKEGWLAVANTIFIRMVKRSKNLKDIVLEPYQFSPVLGMPKTTRKMIARERAVWKRIKKLSTFVYNNPAFVESWAKDKGLHCHDHFITAELAWRKPPRWYRKQAYYHKFVNGHVFVCLNGKIS